MIPQFSVLVQEYHVSSELAMAICRPAIRCYDEILRKTPRSVIGPTSSEVVNATYAARWKMYSKELLDDIHIALRSESDETLFVGMNKEMYVTFWSSVLYDIHVPFPQYEAEIARLRNAVTIGSVSGQLTASERKKAKEKTTQLIEKLINEQKDQVNHRKKVFERLEQKKTSFFVNGLQNHDTIIELLQKCVLPRVLLSPEDALFTAKFMERLHQINTPGFSTLQYYHMINLKLPTMVLCVTEREAGNFGIFLKESLSLLLRWYQNITLYEEGAIGKVGFSLDSNKMLGHRQFKKMYSKWHKWMEKVYATTLQSEEYMQIRNTLIVLTKVIDVFPSNKSTAVRLLQIVEVLTNEDREDIKIMAKRYYALLGKQKTVLLEDKLLSTAASTAAVVAANAKKKASEEAVAKKKRDSSPSHSVQGEESRSSSSKKTDSERQSVNTRHDDQRGSRDSTRTFSEHHRKGREKDRERSEDRRQELERISDSVIVLESNPKEKEPTRKKQRVELELTEEELRRQLTEKKEQEKRKSDEKVEMGKSKGDDNETRGVAGKVVSISYRKRERDTNSGEDREHVNQANISKNKRDGDKGQQKQHHSEKRAQDEKKKKHNANLKSDRSQNNRDSR
jgi:THO complex subunit 2